MRGYHLSEAGRSQRVCTESLQEFSLGRPRIFSLAMSVTQIQIYSAFEAGRCAIAPSSPGAL